MKLLPLVVSLLAAQSAPVIALDCSQGDLSQSEMDECASRQFTSSDAKLNGDYRRVLACLKPYDGHEKPLIEAQRAWLRFRDLECQFQGSTSEGGSVQPMVISLCLKKVTEDRIKQLSYYLSCPEGDVSCPTAACKGRSEANASALGHSNTTVKDGPDGLILKTGPSAFDEHHVIIIDAAQFSERISAMNRSAADVKSTDYVIRCEQMISIGVGGEGGNSSYGGLCYVKGPTSLRQAEACNDKLVGHFHVKEIGSEKPTKIDLAQYVGRFCWGG